MSSRPRSRGSPTGSRTRTTRTGLDVRRCADNAKRGEPQAWPIGPFIGSPGITVFGSDGNGGGRLTQWVTPAFEVGYGEKIPAGIDGEAVVFDLPLHFDTRPAALSVRIALQHPGASPSASLPESPSEALHKLMRVAARHGG